MRKAEDPTYWRAIVRERGFCTAVDYDRLMMLISSEGSVGIKFAFVENVRLQEHETRPTTIHDQ